MWQIDNRTPFAAERCWVRDRDGAEVWLVAVKATFDILPDGSTLVSDDQPPVLQVAEHHAEPGKSSVKYDADLVLTKTTTDVIVVGHAHAPHGAPVAQLDVGFKVGALRKVLRVFGNRTWGLGSPSAPLPFARMPLVYERAYGGIDHASKTPDTDWDWRNPVGTGFAKSAGNAAGVALPNIEDPNALIGSTGDRPPPAGFGVIASHWQPRVALGGTYDDRWMKTRQPLLAEDLDDRFFQSAPAGTVLHGRRRVGGFAQPFAGGAHAALRAAAHPPGLRDLLLWRRARDSSTAQAAHRHSGAGLSACIAGMAFLPAMPFRSNEARAHHRDAQDHTERTAHACLRRPRRRERWPGGPLNATQ